MRQLVKITDNKEIGQAVNARELYQFLGYKIQHWAVWYKKNISKNSFAIDQEDFIELPLSGRTKDFALSIDFAKRLSMMARTEKGEQARIYFLEMEKMAKNPFENLSKLDVLRLATESEERRLLLEKQIEIQAPKVKYCDKVLDSKSTYATTLIAKELGMGAVTLNRLLNVCKIQHKVDGTWVLYSRYQNNGFTKTKTYTFIDSHGVQKTSMQTTWTEKGRFFIHQQIHNYQVDNQLNINKRIV